MQKEDTSILQDNFLSTLNTEQSPVTLFLVNGVKLQGISHR